ncbi:hypothetical protein AMELA_G00049490, partial [Ameiurus melas]
LPVSAKAASVFHSAQQTLFKPPVHQHRLQGEIFFGHPPVCWLSRKAEQIHAPQTGDAKLSWKLDNTRRLVL